MKKKLICGILSAAVLLSVFAGCAPAATGGPSAPPAPAVSATPEPTPTPAPTPEPTPELLSFDKKSLLTAHLISERDAGNEEISFRYTGKTPDPIEFSQLLGVWGVNFARMDGDRYAYTMTVTEMPGDRMIRAYQTGDTSVLATEVEREVYRKVLELVDGVKAAVGTDDIVALELALVDAICEMSTPVSNEVYDVSHISFEERQEYWAAGVFLDGKANSFGYSDAFYAAGTIAGLTLDRMYFKKPDSASVINPDMEMANLILLDGAWYIVHVGETDKWREAHGVEHQLVNRGVEARVYWDWFDDYEKRELSLSRYGDKAPDFENIPIISGEEDFRFALGKQYSYNAKVILFELSEDLSFSELFHSSMTWYLPYYTRTIDVNGHEITCLFLGYFVGDRIADAYLNGNVDRLTTVEKEALAVAVEMVENAKDKTSVVEKEISLLTQLKKSMWYDQENYGTDAYGWEYKSSAIGAFVYKQGHCQAYADAFYALAFMSGINTRKLNVVVLNIDAENPHHIVTAVEIEGDWYIADPLCNEVNVGRNRAIKEYTWDEWDEIVPISPDSPYYATYRWSRD